MYLFFRLFVDTGAGVLMGSEPADAMVLVDQKFMYGSVRCTR